MSKSLLEIKEYSFEYCTIAVKLDRRLKTLSFVEWDNSCRAYKDKRWLFASRELKYMNGWVHILQSMQYIINDCKPIMESWDEEDTETIIKLLEAESERQL